jgi:hypothetical protein
VLYQDEFEVVNPLGAAKGKHKILAVYYTLANLLPSARSKIDALQLVLLCKRVDFVNFGANVIFDRLINDLKDLETAGIDLGPDFGTRKGTVIYVLGDNLGSHMIRGFLESFSGTYFCRFCLATSDCLKTDTSLPPLKFEQRTCENYDAAVATIEINNLENFQGIKKKSVLNELAHFHVCTPALPPCIGHDLFEGIIPSDLTLCIRHFVKIKKWFTYAFLNKKIISFKLFGSDARDKPAGINVQSGKVCGHAVQMWTFIRFLPLLIGAQVEDTNDEVWGLVLLLREIVELVCATRATLDQAAVMGDKIEQYLEDRLKLFPANKLKPKHHFMSHYPRLTMECGPLIRLWTLRFESKHSYLKTSARSAQNFINITRTLAVKHQLLQAYYSAGSLFGSTVEVKSGQPFHFDLFCKQIQTALNNFPHLKNSHTTEVADSVTVNNTTYSKGSYIALKRDEVSLVFGEIKIIFVHENRSTFFAVIKKRATFLVDFGLHEVTDCNEDLWDIVTYSDILDFAPLHVYTVNCRKFLVLHHYI